MDSSARPTVPACPAVRLTSRDLVVLQLVARGYTPAQIDGLLEADGATERALRSASAALGAEGLAQVLDEARLRGLIT